MADGSRKPIEKIKPGEMVLSFDPQGRIHKSKVLRVLRHNSIRDGDHLIRLKFWSGKTLVATTNHPFLLGQTRKFIPAGELQNGYLAIDRKGRLDPVVEISGPLPFEPVYNLEVEGFHTYIAGGYRVHNGGGNGGGK
jgi:intein/homing endonuclease